MLPYLNAFNAFLMIFNSLPVSMRTFVVFVLLSTIVVGALILFLSHSG